MFQKLVTRVYGIFIIMNKLEKIAFLMPRGAMYRYKTGAFKQMIRYAPLTIPALISLIPEDMNIKYEVYDEGVEQINLSKVDADLICITSITGGSSRALGFTSNRVCKCCNVGLSPNSENACSLYISILFISNHFSPFSLLPI